MKFEIHKGIFIKITKLFKKYILYKFIYTYMLYLVFENEYFLLDSFKKMTLSLVLTPSLSNILNT